ncbi:calcium-binding protein [Microvirga terricola]|uniref:Calcium-binding protein n=1 Tax=Microvirga terricola TaxID=2719797 RepID=A0ABX0V9T8_9HYPH|nr:calcium-binding protein [Microvirga terricola]
MTGEVILGRGNDRAYGGASAETFDLGIGNDYLNGGGGQDTIVFSVVDLPSSTAITIDLNLTGPQVTPFGIKTIVSVENIKVVTTGDDKLIGNGVANELSGGDGKDTLEGGGGDDILNGGAHDDRLDGGSGFDTVVFRDLGVGVVANMANPADAANTTGADRYINVEALRGTAYADKFTGDGIGNLLSGLAGNDTLDGGEGADQLIGGLGNDTYIIDTTDTVVELASQGTDTVIASISYTLGANLENLTAGGAGAIQLTGNTFGNVIVGNGAANVIRGGLGNDTLTGGAAKDIFVFDTKPNKKTNFDTITDFNVKDDTIWLDNAAFTKLGKGTLAKPGELNKAFFTIGDKAKDGNDYLIYSKKTGVLYYDADGSGAGKAVEIAQLKKGLKMTYADFFVI